MRRKITYEFVLVVIIALLAFIVGGFFIAKNNMNEITKHNLNKYLEIVIIEYEENPTPLTIVNKYESVEDYLRITFMSPNGDVIADSLAENLENHINRPEFTDLGTVYIRTSATLNVEMMYLAYELDDGNFVRVSIPTSSILPFVNDFMGLTVIIGILILGITVIISQALINSAMHPLKEIKGILRDVNNGKYSDLLPVQKQDEINDLINEINDINRLIATNISSLVSEKEKNDFLLSHMDQGICVLDKDGLIVMINQYLRRLLRFNIDININKDYRYLFRDNDIQDSIEKAYKKEISTNTILHIKDGYYSVSISYLEKNWLNQPSVILLFTDITAIKNIENLKKDFFDNASHELKSPLTSIIGSSDIILQGMAKDDKMILDLASRISEEAKRMNNLVMDMLMLSRYENQTQIVVRQDIDINSILNEVTNSLVDLIKKKNANINIESRSYYINANYDEMFQLLKNLIENSVKYGKNEGNVNVSIKKDEKNLIINVSDNGIGIPKEDQNRIFERFYRVDKARSNSAGGTGLGLSIVKHIVMNYEGHIELESVEDKGTSITVYIPNNQIKVK
jgi:two-component system phosphate regulon sensor histidine kinase PhoR